MLCERKSERKEVAVRGWIFAEGQDPRQCTIEDASAGGAKLLTANPDSLPDRFEFGFTQHAPNRRTCVVRWRRDGRVGVQFGKPGVAKEASAQGGSEGAECGPAMAVRGSQKA